MTRCMLGCVLLIAVSVMLSPGSIAEEGDARPVTVDPIHHALVQKKVGFYAVYLPPDYHAEANKDREWPVCVILHGHGSTETGHGGLSNSFGRDGVIYVAPRAPHVHKGLLAEGRTGYTAWATYPEAWGDWDSETFPQDEIEKLQTTRLYTDWIADCIADVRSRYRVDDQRAVVVGHSQGAMFSMTFALHRPELVRAHFAYAGHYWSEVEDDIAAQTLKKHDIHTFVAHCEGDVVVPPEGAQRLVEYLAEHEVPHEALIVPGGHHGFTSRISRAAQEFVAKWCRGEELPPLEGKLEVTTVVADSQAAGIGMQVGDVITSYNGKAIANMDDLTDAIAAAAEEEEVIVEWQRGDEKFSAKVKPGRLGIMVADR
jgi:predicted esterase